MSNTPKGVLQLTRWRWYGLACCVPSVWGLFFLCKHPHLAVQHVPAWEAPFIILGYVSTCFLTAMIWYAHLYWKRQVR